MLDKFEIKRDRTLKCLFCSDLSRTILLHYWDEIIKGLYVMNIEAQSSEKLITEIRKVFPQKRPNSVLALMGFVMICQQIGTRGAQLALNLSNSQFYSLNADVKKLCSNRKCFVFSALAAVRKELEYYYPLSRLGVLQPVRARA